MSGSRSGWLERIGSLAGVITSNVGAVVILLVIGHFALGGAVEIKRWLTGEEADERVELPAYEGVRERSLLGREWREANARRSFRPHYLWKSDEYHGRFVNVDSDGVRRTVGADAVRPDARKVFVLGGSTIWGEGVADGDTIPSRLQRLLGDGYLVSNFGEIGFMSIQELNYLIERLAFGERPDIVIYYDGVNDGYTSVYSPYPPRGVHNIEELLDIDVHRQSISRHLLGLFRTSSYAKLGRFFPARGQEAWDEQVAPRIDENVARTLDVYEEFIRMNRAIAGEYGYEVYFFWQPSLFSRTRQLLPYEQEILDGYSPVWAESQRRFYLGARQRFSGREGERIFFLGNVLDEAPEPIYIDWCHLNHRGNAIVAAEMADRVAGGTGSRLAAGRKTGS